MKISLALASATAFAGLVAAVDDLLFHYSFTGWEDYVAAGGSSYDSYTYNWTYYVADPDEWSKMSTNDFKQYKAIIIGDPIDTDPEFLEPLMTNRQTWGAAISGNVILIGTDTSNHYSNAKELMTNGIAFAASGQGTGLYFSLSKYYGNRNKTTVEILDIFGNFEVRGDLNSEEQENCYDNVHIVAVNSVLDGITDTVLSNWSCSVHEAFVTYPSTGDNSFVPLAIAEDVPGEGSKDFSDGTKGIPYILVRGASPIGCGNGVLDPGEECDDGNTKDGDGCNYACRFESTKKPAAGTIAGGVVGAVAGVAALAGLSYLALTKTAAGAKVAGAIGIGTGAASGGGAGAGGGASSAAGMAGAAYIPTGLEGKAAASVATPWVPTGAEAASTTPYAPGAEKLMTQGAHAAANGVTQASSGLYSTIPVDPTSLATQAGSAAVPPPVDPGSGAAATQAFSSGIPPVDPSSAAAVSGSGAVPPPAGYVPGAETVATQTAATGGAATTSQAAGTMGTGTAIHSAGAITGGTGGAAAGGTAGGMTAQETAAAIAAGFAGLTATLFGRRKKKTQQASDPEYMPTPPGAPVQYQQQQPLQQEPYAPYAQAPQNYYPYPQQPSPQAYDEKEIKTGETSQPTMLNVGVQEVVPTPSSEPQINPVEMEQPNIPPPPQSTGIWAPPSQQEQQYQQPGFHDYQR